MSVGKIIKRARSRVGMTLKELGACVGRSASQLSLIENDEVANPLSPADMVQLSDSVCDRQMLVEYCDACPIRNRIVIKKFPRLNNIEPGPQVAMLKVMEKLASSSDALSHMLPKMLNKNFRDDPDYREFRNEAILQAFQVKHGMETLFDQWVEHGLVTQDELQILEEMHERHCVERGHIVPEG